MARELAPVPAEAAVPALRDQVVVRAAARVQEQELVTAPVPASGAMALEAAEMAAALVPARDWGPDQVLVLVPEREPG